MQLISHPREGNLPEKSLFEHLFNVAEASTAEIKRHHLKLSQISKNDIERLSFLIGVLHDFGKSTTFFQKHVGEKRFREIFPVTACSQQSYVIISSCRNFLRKNGLILHFMLYIAIMVI